MQNVKRKLRLGAVVFCAIAGMAGTELCLQGQSFLNALDLVRPAFAEDGAPVRGHYSPPELYHRAWELIKDSYYDRKYNGQDWEAWAHKYDGKLNTQIEAEKAIKEMLVSLGDPNTRFLGVESFSDVKGQIQAKLFGIGLNLCTNKENKVVVVSAEEDSSASKAGIRAGDEIVEVNQKSIKGQSLDKVVRKLRGENGTTVTVTFLRGAKTMTASLLRDGTPAKSVVYEVLPGDIGYLRIRSFISQKLTDEVRAALSSLAEKTDNHDPARALIIDVRGDAGGLLTNAIDLANIFLKKGVILQTVDTEEYKTAQLATRSSIKNDLPLVVLINKDTASSAEMFSAALQENGRARLVGQTSSGAGLIQSINVLGNGTGLNISIGRCLTPNSFDFNKKGIKPDFEVNLSADDLTSGKGPWWVISDGAVHLPGRSAADGKDIQLTRAIEVVKQENVGKSLPAAKKSS